VARIQILIVRCPGPFRAIGLARDFGDMISRLGGVEEARKLDG